MHAYQFAAPGTVSVTVLLEVEAENEEAARAMIRDDQALYVVDEQRQELLEIKANCLELSSVDGGEP